MGNSNDVYSTSFVAMYQNGVTIEWVNVSPIGHQRADIFLPGTLLLRHQPSHCAWWRGVRGRFYICQSGRPPHITLRARGRWLTTFLPFVCGPGVEVCEGIEYGYDAVTIAYEIADVPAAIWDALGDSDNDLGVVQYVLKVATDYSSLEQDLGISAYPYVMELGSSGNFMWSDTIGYDTGVSGLLTWHRLGLYKRGRILDLVAGAYDGSGMAPNFDNGTLLMQLSSSGSIMDQAAVGNTVGTSDGASDQIASITLSSTGTLEVAGTASGMPNAFYVTEETADKTSPTPYGPHIPALCGTPAPPTCIPFNFGVDNLVGPQFNTTASHPAITFGASVPKTISSKATSGAYLELINQPDLLTFSANPTANVQFWEDGAGGNKISSIYLISGFQRRCRCHTRGG